MKDVGKISVVLPCYKAERFVGSMIDDVKGQTYPDWELIVVSNGEGQERQLEVVRAEAEADKRIRVISLEQGGVSNARNVGMQNATGQWLAFVDADDRCDSHYLENLAQGVRDDVDMVVGGIIVTNSNTDEQGDVYNLEAGHGLDSYYFSVPDLCTNAPWNKLLNISKICEWGGVL